jgi:hypothetical protein
MKDQCALGLSRLRVSEKAHHRKEDPADYHNKQSERRYGGVNSEIVIYILKLG